MTRILLIRHGSTDLMSVQLCGRLPHIPLNDIGRTEAAQLARAMNGRFNLSAIYSSPIQRAQETAAAIASTQGLPVQTAPGVTELEFGDWTGRAFEALHSDPIWHAYNTQRSLHAAPGGEGLLDVQRRAWRTLSELTDLHPDQTVAVVSHGDVIRSVLALVLGMPADNLLRLEVAPTSICDLSLGGAYPVVHQVNLLLHASEQRS